MSYKFLIKNSKGFTLVELLIYIGLLGIMLVVLTQVFTSALDVQTETEAASFVDLDSRFIINRLTYDIHRAQSITTPAALGATNSTLQLVIGGTNSTYALNGGNLEITDSVGTDRLNSVGSTISAFTVKRLGNTNGKNSLQISFTITSTTVKNGGQPETKNISTTIGIR